MLGLSAMAAAKRQIVLRVRAQDQAADDPRGQTAFDRMNKKRLAAKGKNIFIPDPLGPLSRRNDAQDFYGPFFVHFSNTTVFGS